MPPNGYQVKMSIMFLKPFIISKQKMLMNFHFLLDRKSSLLREVFSLWTVINLLNYWPFVIFAPFLKNVILLVKLKA